MHTLMVWIVGGALLLWEHVGPWVGYAFAAYLLHNLIASAVAQGVRQEREGRKS